MLTPRVARFLPAILLSAMLPASAEAASLSLDGGAVLSVHPLPPRIGAPAGALASAAPLAYSVTDAAGRLVSGTIPGTEGAQAREVSLARNPLNGDVVMAFAAPGAGGHDIAAVTWTGQSWTAPRDLAVGDADERAPLLTFRPGGDALAAWISGDGEKSLLLRHFDMTSSDDIRTFAYFDVGTLRQIGGEEALRRGVEPRLVALVGSGSDALAAYLFIGDASGAPLSVARLELDATVDPGGFGAAPVPVSFIRTATQSAGSGSTLTGRAGDTAQVGEILAPWRIVVGSGQAWYWVERAGAWLVPFEQGAAGAPVSLGFPSTEAMLHVEAFRAARALLGADVRRAGSAQLPAGSRRLR